MTDTKKLFVLLPLFLLACTLTAQSAAVSASPLQKQMPTASPTPAPKMCKVRTGVDAGALNMRTCGALNCPVVIVLREGETLTQNQAQAVNDWFAVKTANGLTGWVNSNYINCEVKK